MTLNSRVFTNLDDIAVALTEEAIKPGMGVGERAYRTYARDFGVLMSKALASKEADQISGMLSSLMDTVAIAVGNLMLQMPTEDAMAFHSSVCQSMQGKLDTHPKIIAESATRHLKERSHG